MEAIEVANTTTTTTNTAVDGGVVENKKISEGKIVDATKKNRIQVSNTKKPLFFYLNLAKRCIKQHNHVVLSALGMGSLQGINTITHANICSISVPAIPTVVTIAEILKANGLAMEKGVWTSTIGMKDEAKGRMIQKPKIEIALGKNEIAEILEANRPNPVIAPKEEADAEKESEITAAEIV
ncbi:hypothetical protein Vadar_012665 [Vaccinium darrowii]|uniref:Uncharacterized protein n=1 Tax=Vaccinium darrowii TaxID=229202 RepID=A0ACB7YVY0_9ERIC|nr:hypothetical protein Vadar_012665 [Vaccinium darrowii]